MNGAAGEWGTATVESMMAAVSRMQPAAVTHDRSGRTDRKKFRAG